MKRSQTTSSTRDGYSSRTRPSSASLIALARNILQAEIQAIQRIRLDSSFNQAVQLILQRTGGRAMQGERSEKQISGSVVVSGIGKSGLIGRKISATLASTGTPSLFLHPTEAMHGDLGKVRRGDVVLILSYGGNTDEVVALASILRQDRVPVVAMVGNKDCDLGRLATVTLELGDVTEACPHNLAPTASTTAMLAMGDALALCVSKGRNFGVTDFHRMHPGGSLGKQLLPVTGVMRLKAGEDLPVVPIGVTVAQGLREAEKFAHSGRRVGAFLIVDRQGKLAGIFTDGDLRRLILNHGPAGLELPIKKVMAAHPRRLPDTALVRDAVKIAREYRFDEMPVVDAKGRPVGLIDVQDLVALKVIEG